MEDGVLNGVELDVLQHCLALNTVDGEVYKVDVGSVNELTNSVYCYSKSLSFLLDSVQNARNTIVLTELVGALLAYFGTCSTFQIK